MTAMACCRCLDCSKLSILYEKLICEIFLFIKKYKLFICFKRFTEDLSCTKQYLNIGVTKIRKLCLPSAK